MKIKNRGQFHEFEHHFLGFKASFGKRVTQHRQKTCIVKKFVLTLNRNPSFFKMNIYKDST